LPVSAGTADPGAGHETQTASLGTGNRLVAGRLRPSSSTRELKPGRFGFGTYAADRDVDRRVRYPAHARWATPDRTIAFLFEPLDNLSGSRICCQGASYPWQVEFVSILTVCYYRVNTGDLFAIACFGQPAVGEAALYVVRFQHRSDGLHSAAWLFRENSPTITSTRWDEGFSLHDSNNDLILGSLGSSSAPECTFLGWIYGFWMWTRALSDAEVYLLARDPFVLHRPYWQREKRLLATGFGTVPHYRLYRGQGGPEAVDFSTCVGIARPGDGQICLFDDVDQPPGQWTYALRACSVGWKESDPLYVTVEADEAGTFQQLPVPQITELTPLPGGYVKVCFQVTEPDAGHQYEVLAGRRPDDLQVVATLDGGRWNYSLTLGPLEDGRWIFRVRTASGRPGPLSAGATVRVDGSGPESPVCRKVTIQQA